jgi:hypothetical protein
MPFANQHYPIANRFAPGWSAMHVELTGLVDFRQDPSSKARNGRKRAFSGASALRASSSFNTIRRREAAMIVSQLSVNDGFVRFSIRPVNSTGEAADPLARTSTND